VRPRTVPPARRGWLPLLAGVAVASAVHAVASVDARLKWPNDVLVGQAKLGGILAEAAGDAVVVGIGLNVSTEPGELPPPGPAPTGALPATSLRALADGTPADGTPADGTPADGSMAAGSLDRESLLTGILAGFERRYQAWVQADGDQERCGLRAEYTGLCATIGRRVRAELPGGQLLSGLAAGVDPDGRLVVRLSPDSEVPVAAGDVVHLR
jgi:BirA family biotin operon repressor/biotin-[acetyl-CoA-carboxylase] ligase